MWSLGSMKKLEQESAAKTKCYEKMLRTGKDGRKKIKCEYDDEHCTGEVRLTPWYDIFGPSIKGLDAKCEYHSDREGTPEEFFYCDGCERTIISNYTWEIYSVEIDGQLLCLPCALVEYLGDEDHWLKLTDEVIDGLTFNQVRRAKHLIGVQMPHPGLEFRGNTEFDSMDGHCISGGGVAELQELMRQARADGYTKGAVILDAGYQFAVSLGFYVPERGGVFDTKAEPEVVQPESKGIAYA